MTPDFLTYIRHLSKQDRKSLTQKALKTVEEVGELAKVVLPYENAYATTHRFVERERILEESVDTILCALSVAYDLDFTDEEVDEMLIRKSEKWNQLQINEADVKYPLPFEIHITVKIGGGETGIFYTNDHMVLFRNICAQGGMKAIVIDLQSRTGLSVMMDVMTSANHFGDNRSAYLAAQSQVAYLKEHGYEVVRVKIETVPWHPAAPKILAKDMPPHCYFEAHVPVSIEEGDKELLRESMAIELGRGHLHLSNNTFKKNPDGTSVVMFTLRRDDCVARVFKSYVGNLVSTLERNGIGTVGKVHTEFAVYDTKVSHDAAWIAG